jgi:glyoxylase-like metal-dependent hydrolase (beta-lactamase superfamily II)
MNQPSISIARIVSRPLDENTYVARLANRNDAIVVDPGFEPNLILDYLSREKLDVAAILNTHGHGDHIAGNAAIKQAFPNAPIVIGELDAPMLSNPMLNLAAMAGARVTSPPADRLVNDGDVVEAAGIRLDVRHIPGHSPGHVVYVCHENAPPIVLGGDVLFAGSVGRCDLPGGSMQTLIAGIRQKIFTLPDGTCVFPGHGPQTTVARERQFNRYAGEGGLAIVGE